MTNGNQSHNKNFSETLVEYNKWGIVENYVCPNCGSEVTLDHEDDVGTKFFKCVNCGEQSSRLVPAKRKSLDTFIKEITKELTLDELKDILNSTIKHDKRNKLITFLAMVLTYTEADQINVSFTAESSTGKSYIPLELAWYFSRPCGDVLKYSYVSPTAFFHEYGTLMTDPTDLREIEDNEKRKIVEIDLRQKILIFLDQPHDILLQRLRPLLSHDEKELVIKITDQRKRGGLRTKTALIRGYPTVVFCTAKFSMAQQERTRLLLLSPETTQEKIKDSIKLRIEKESDRQGFFTYMESNPNRNWLRARVDAIKQANIRYVVIPTELREKVTSTFFLKHEKLIPRHQRDIGRLLSLIKAHALLNLFNRERLKHSNVDLQTVVANKEDVGAGLKLYGEISEANELGLSPEVYNIYVKLKDKIPDEGMTRKELQTLYYQTFHRTIGKKRLDEILNILQSVGLIIEEPDKNDRRQKRFLVVCDRVFNSKNDEQDGKDSQKINTLSHTTTPQKDYSTTPKTTPTPSMQEVLENARRHLQHGGAKEDFVKDFKKSGYSKKKAEDLFKRIDGKEIQWIEKDGKRWYEWR